MSIKFDISFILFYNYLHASETAGIANWWVTKGKPHQFYKSMEYGI